MPVRDYTSRRWAIVEALAEAFKVINGTGDYATNIYGQAYAGLKFWDEIQTFPSIFVIPGDETREYQSAGYKDRFLQIIISIYVHEDNSLQALEALLEDAEVVIENNAVLRFTSRAGNAECTRDILITSITTDEGVLEPYGVAQIDLQVQY